MRNILLAAVFILFLSGCSDSTDNHPLLRKAAQSKRMGEYRNAETCYKRYLAKNPAAAKIHLALAELYDEQLEEYLLAVYHYKEYLRLTPDKESRSAKNVRGFIERSERRYVNKNKSVKKVLLTDEAEIERMTAAYKKRLADEEKKLAQELAELKKEADKTQAPDVSETLKSDSAVVTEKTSENNSPDSAVEVKSQAELAEKQSADSSIVNADTANNTPDIGKNTADKTAEKVEEKKTGSAEIEKKEPEKKSAEVIKDFSKLPKMEEMENTPVSAPGKKEIKDYKVQKGDTFTHLSRKFYGTVRYYRQLMEYNKINNPSSLRVGKTIKIPPLEILKGEK